MNFKNKIKDLKQHAKKMSLKKMGFKGMIGLGILSSVNFLCLSISILLMYLSLTTNQNLWDIALFSLITSLAYSWMMKITIDDAKAKQYIINQTIISEFIGSFPKDYHEQVKHHIADKMGEKKSFSLFDLKTLEKDLKMETLKNMKESETKFRENYKNIILEKQREHVIH